MTPSGRASPGRNRQISPCSPKLADCGPNSVELGPLLVDSQPELTESGQFGREFGRTWTCFGRCQAELGRTRPTCGPHRPNSGQSFPDFDRRWLLSIGFAPDLSALGPKCCPTRAHIGRIGADVRPGRRNDIDSGTRVAVMAWFLVA